MWIKICGNTSLAEARLAVDLGADALGFIFAPSRRRVTPHEVADISPLLPDHVERIGVFTAGEPEAIAAAATHAGLTGVQLHAAFPPDFYTRLEAAAEGRLAVIRTLHWITGRRPNSENSAEPESGSISPQAQAETLARDLEQIAGTAPHHRVLLDSRVDDALGGTGTSFPWGEAAAPLAAARGSLSIVVAGGLRPETVAEAIRVLSPYGVDVVSGVESEPGRKDPERLRHFIEQARSVEGHAQR